MNAQNSPDNLYKEYKAWIDIKDTKGVQGTKFLYGTWNKGMLVLNDSLFFMQNNLAYDAYDAKIFIKQENTAETVFEVNDVSLTGFSIFDETNQKHDFVKLNHTNFKTTTAIEAYYEILNNSYKTNYFIKSTVIVLFDPNKSKGTAAINNYPLEFKEAVNYYIKETNNLYVEVKLRKKEILKLLTKHTDKIDQFIKTKNISFNNELQVAELVNYYYSLN
jgi:hypothetical protein